MDGTAASAYGLLAILSILALLKMLKNSSWQLPATSEIIHLLSKSIPGRTPKDFFRRTRVIMYALLHPFAARIWLKALLTDSLLAEIAARNRRFLERPFHCFAQADMSTRARVELLCGHFRVIQTLFGEDLLRRLYLKSEYVTLASSGRYALVVSEPVRCWREGLLTVAWRDELEHIDLAWATISFESHPASGKRGALIGGLQGPASGERERVREATRACHGLRPKAAVMEAISELSRMAGVTTLAGVAKQTHVSSATAIRFSADYDAFWRELGGIEVDGRFVLPLHTYHRDISDVPSNRRAAFRRRQTLITDLRQQVCQALSANLTGDVVQSFHDQAKADDRLPELAVALDYCDAELA
jgi:uncharacterized protein